VAVEIDAVEQRLLQRRSFTHHRRARRDSTRTEAGAPGKTLMDLSRLALEEPDHAQ